MKHKTNKKDKIDSLLVVSSWFGWSWLLSDDIFCGCQHYRHGCCVIFSLNYDWVE